MYTALSILIIIASILMVLIVLVQNSKGGGLAANFASGNQAFGFRQTANFLEKATWGLAIVIIVLCVLAAVFINKGVNEGGMDVTDKIEESINAEEAPALPTLPVEETTPAVEEQEVPAE